MKIAYLCADPGVPVFGRKGCSIHVQEMVRAFRRGGHSVTLFSRRWGDAPPADLQSVPRVELPRAAAPERASYEKELSDTEKSVPGLLQRHGPFDLLYERYSLFSSSALRWAQEHRLPSILEVNAPLIEEQAKHRELGDLALAERHSSAAMASATGILAVSSGIAEWLAGAGIAERKITVIGNGVDTQRFAACDRLATEIPTIGFLGTFKVWHGLETLIEALELLRQEGNRFRLLMIGDGPLRPALEKQVHDLGLDAETEFTGSVPPEQVPGLLTRVDIAVAPYPDIPGFYFSPLKVAEYMAAGCAVVASRIGTMAELIEDGVNGRFSPPADASALAGIVRELLSDPEQRARLGRAARRHAEANLGWDQVAARALELVEAREPC